MFNETGLPVEALARFPFELGLFDLAHGVYAYTQPDGGWSLSNAGLIVDHDQSLLVDTLFDLKLTAAMLERMRAAEPVAARSIRTVVNTHANPDHTNGNMLLDGAEIIASAGTARGMRALRPERVASMVAQARAHAEHDPTARYLLSIFGRFELDGIEARLPTREFEGQLDLKVGDTDVQIIEVGPAHTASDVIVYVPKAKVVFTGDILFIGGHPIMWAGPVSNWLTACERLLALDVDVVVPGHGPITDKRGVRAMHAYLSLVHQLAGQLHVAGFSANEAARAIYRELEGTIFGSWRDAERLLPTVACIYRELDHSTAEPAPAAAFAEMATLAAEIKDRWHSQR